MLIHFQKYPKISSEILKNIFAISGNVDTGTQSAGSGRSATVKRPEPRGIPSNVTSSSSSFKFLMLSTYALRRQERVCPPSMAGVQDSESCHRWKRKRKGIARSAGHERVEDMCDGIRLMLM
jgi:hypothetical protein